MGCTNSIESLFDRLPFELSISIIDNGSVNHRLAGQDHWGGDRTDRKQSNIVEY